MKRSIGTKGYLADHYISFCLRLISQIDFIGLQDEVFDTMAAVMRNIPDAEAKKLFDS